MILEVRVGFVGHIDLLDDDFLQEALEVRAMESAKKPLILKNVLDVFHVIIIVQTVRD